MLKLALAVVTLSGVAFADSAKKKSPPTVNVGTPTVSAGGNANAVHGTVWRAKTKLAACYQKSATGNIKVTAMFAIAPNGKVEPGTTSLFGATDARLEACVVGVLSKLVFAKGPEKVEVELPLELDQTVRTAGILGQVTTSGETYGGLFGDGGETSGGFGSSGGGGRGTGWGTIGTGRYGTIGSGTGYGAGSGRVSAVSTVSIGQPQVTGDLDKAIIRRYLKRNIQRITYCYEKERAVKPSIGGTLTLQFTIAVDGKVTSSTSDAGLKDATVESCVVAVVKAIEFPKPKNDAEVLVVYPITFRPPPADAKPTK